MNESKKSMLLIGVIIIIALLGDYIFESVFNF